MPRKIGPGKLAQTLWKLVLSLGNFYLTAHHLAGLPKKLFAIKLLYLRIYIGKNIYFIYYVLIFLKTIFFIFFCESLVSLVTKETCSTLACLRHTDVWAIVIKVRFHIFVIWKRMFIAVTTGYKTKLHSFRDKEFDFHSWTWIMQLHHIAFFRFFTFYFNVLNANTTPPPSLPESIALIEQNVFRQRILFRRLDQLNRVSQLNKIQLGHIKLIKIST